MMDEFEFYEAEREPSKGKEVVAGKTTDQAVDQTNPKSRDEVEEDGAVQANPSGSEGEDAGEGDEEEEDIYEVERIVDKRKKGRSVEYLIKWKGYPASANTWEKRSNLFCEELLEEFERQWGEKEKQAKKESNTPSRRELAKQRQERLALKKQQEQQEAKTAPKTRKKKRAAQKEPQQPQNAQPNKRRRRKKAEVLEPVGFEYGDEVDTIFGVDVDEEGLKFLVSWRGKTRRSFVASSVLKQLIPQRLIAWYESRLRFSPGEAGQQQIAYYDEDEGNGSEDEEEDEEDKARKEEESEEEEEPEQEEAEEEEDGRRSTLVRSEAEEEDDDGAKERGEIVMEDKGKGKQNENENEVTKMAMVQEEVESGVSDTETIFHFSGSLLGSDEESEEIL
ncbi:M-phase phosphoprotein 8 [Balamuthia mandrillaris]